MKNKTKKRVKQKKQNWKLIIFFVFLLIGIILIGISIYILNKPSPLLNPLNSFSIPTDCSDSEIQATWDTIFKETSTGITIIKNTSNSQKCNSLLAYKILNQQTAYILTNYNENQTNNLKLSALRANLTSTGITELTDIEYVNYDSNPNIIISLITSPKSSFNNRTTEIPNLNRAANEFISVFDLIYSTWETTISGDDTIYYFEDNETISGKKITENGVVLSYHNATWYHFFNITISDCTPTWQQTNTTCQSGDTFTAWFNDTSKCNNLSTKPTNITYDCDYDNNGIIGNFNSFSQHNTNLNIYINNTQADISDDFTSTQKIEFRDGNQTIIEFNYNFSSNPSLNIKNIEIEKQPSSLGYGYLIVSGIPISKTLKIDRKTSSNKVCVKNKEINMISELSDNCTFSNEYLISCPGNYGNFICTITNDKFTVSGLTNSVVKEIYSTSTPTTTCTSNWNCTDWSDCTNQEKIRFCNDINKCNTSIKKETQFCSPPCQTNWNCTSWSKCKDEIQTRTCTDSNNCGTNSGKPTQTQTCEKSNLTMIIIIILMALVLIFIIYMIYALTKKTDSNLDMFKQPMIRQPPTPPFRPGIPPINPQFQPRRF